MLMIARRNRESIWLHLPGGGQVEFRICKVGKTQVKVGVVAPADVLVTRGPDVLGRKPQEESP